MPDRVLVKYFLAGGIASIIVYGTLVLLAAARLGDKRLNDSRRVRACVRRLVTRGRQEQAQHHNWISHRVGTVRA